MTLRTRFFLLAVLFLFSYREVVSQISFEDEHLRLVETLTIGDDERAPGDYLFARPNHVGVDSIGRIFVSDPMSMSIRIFDADGVFLSEVGKRGSAPGEFQALSAVHISESGDIFVLDGRLARLTHLSAEGLVLETKSIQRSELLWPKRLLSVDSWDDSTRFAFVAKMPVHVSRTDDDSDFIIHFYNPDTWTKTDGAARYSRIFDDYDSDLMRSFSGSHPGNVIVRDTGDLCYAPGLYFGRITCFSSKIPHSEQSLVGHARTTQPIKPTECDEPNTGRGLISITRIKPLPKICGFINSQSAGLFEWHGYLIHFTYSSDSAESHLDYEVFDDSGEMVISGRFPNILYRSWHSQPLLQFSSMDAHGSLYAIDMTDSAPVIRKFNLILNLPDVAP